MNLKDYCSFLKEAGVADPRRYLATELGLSKATINSYICGRRLISPENCLTLVNLSRGHLTCEELRPDIPWKFAQLDRSNAETGRLKKEIKQYLSCPGAEALKIRTRKSNDKHRLLKFEGKRWKPIFNHR